MTQGTISAGSAPQSPDSWTPEQARAAFREGREAPTSGLAPGHTQANMLTVPREYAYDVLLFAQRNPAPCPVLEVTEPGSRRSVLAPGADLRTDLPGYLEAARASAERHTLRDLWLACEVRRVRAGEHVAALGAARAARESSRPGAD